MKKVSASPKFQNPREMRPQASLCVLLMLIFELSSCTELHVIRDSTLQLPCANFPLNIREVTITWKFNGEDISPEVIGPVMFQSNGQYLSIAPVTSANEGEYQCLVKENDVVITTSYKITVSGSFDYSLKVIAGSTVHLPCHLPSPSRQVSANALWFKTRDSGERENLDPQHDDHKRLKLLHPLKHDQTIRITDTVAADAGTYHCEATEGQRISTIVLVVEVGPTPIPLLCKDTSAWEPCEEELSRTGDPILQESLAEFSLKIFSYFRQSYPSSNLIFSPISISSMFSHLLLGAKNETRKAIERAVCLPHDFHCLHFHTKKLRETLSGSLQMASQIYYNPKMNLTESFTDQSIQFYDAKPTRLLNSSEANTHMINSWVANKTNNKITQLVDSISPTTQLVLLNAVFYSGQWKVRFEPNEQRTGFFTKLSGDMVSVPFLYAKGYMMEMMYVTALKAQVGRFALSGDSSLYILLPRSHKASDLQLLEEKMTDAALRQMMKEMKTAFPQPVEVSLPMIKLDVQPDMNILMKKLGLSSLFEEANLCGLYSEDKVLLDDARHRAFFALTEHGVEAGAATATGFARSHPSFSAMRPFIMLLWSDQAAVPLFIGRVTDP